MITSDAALTMHMDAEDCVLISIQAGQEHYPVDDSVAMQLILKTGRPPVDCSLGEGGTCDAALLLFFGVGVLVDQVDSGSVSFVYSQEGVDAGVPTVSGNMRFLHQSGRAWDLSLWEVALVPTQLDQTTEELDGLAYRAPDVLAAWSRECGLEEIVGPRLGREPRRRH